MKYQEVLTFMRASIGSVTDRATPLVYRKASNTELQKASSMSSAELDLFEIFYRICLVFRQIFVFECAIRNNLKIPSVQPVNDANYVKSI